MTGKEGNMPRVKPFKYTYEKEIVMYAYHKKLVYFSTECVYSPNAYRGYVRELIKDLEAQRPSAIIDIIHSGEKFVIDKTLAGTKQQIKRNCQKCGFMSSNNICKACALLDKLAKMKAKKVIEYEEVKILPIEKEKNKNDNKSNIVKIEI